MYVTVNESKSSFGIEGEFYLLVDDEVLKKQVTNKQIKDFDSIQENKSNILTADSTTVNVVTGYQLVVILKSNSLLSLPNKKSKKLHKVNIWLIAIILAVTKLLAY